MSFWSIGSGAIKPAIAMTKKSVELATRYYGGVHLITDRKGAETFKDVDWLSISTELEALPKEYKDVWSLGKIKAYNIIAAKGRPFMHIDYDFFLLNRLPEKIETSDVFFQSKEDFKHFKTYCLDSLYNECDILPLHNKLQIDTAYNCGVVGGVNYDFFQRYTEQSIECILDSRNSQFWLGDNKLLSQKYNCFRAHATKALLAEQYFAAITCHEMGIIPSFIVDGSYYTDRDENEFFIHLYGRHKTSSAYKARVKFL